MSKRSKMPSGYGMVQSAIMRMPNLSLQAKALYSLLASYTGASDYCWPSVETQSNDLNCSKRSIERYQVELEGKDLLRKSRKYPDTLNNLNKYEIMIIDNPPNAPPVSQSKGRPRRIGSVTSVAQNINNKNSSKKGNIEEPARKNGHSIFNIYTALKALFNKDYFEDVGYPLSWAGNGTKYGVALKRLVNAASAISDDPEQQFIHIMDRAEILRSRIKGQVFVKGEPRFLPTTLSMNWNDLTPPKRIKPVAEITDAEFKEQLKDLDF